MSTVPPFSVVVDYAPHVLGPRAGAFEACGVVRAPVSWHTDEHTFHIYRRL